MEVAYYSILTPYPGTRLHQRLTEERRLLTQDWSLYDTSHVVYRPATSPPTNSWTGSQGAQGGLSIRSIFERLWGTTAYKNFFYPMNFGFRQSARCGGCIETAHDVSDANGVASLNHAVSAHHPRSETAPRV